MRFFQYQFNRTVRLIVIQFFLLVGYTSCVREPRILEYQKHSCDFCKMTLVDNHFGVLVETEKGRIYRFDDISCMFRFQQQNLQAVHELPVKMVIDFNHPGNLINAEEAFYLKADQLAAPMNSRIAAFSSKKELEIYQRKLEGIYLVWGELLTQFK